MARENITDVCEASDKYLEQATIHHASRTNFTGSDLQTHTYEKAALKARKFNMPFSNCEKKAEEIILAAKAEAYKKAKEGE